jgi:hypothetical protein
VAVALRRQVGAVAEGGRGGITNPGGTAWVLERLWNGDETPPIPRACYELGIQAVENKQIGWISQHSRLGCKPLNQNGLRKVHNRLYIYCTDFNISGHSCKVTVESQVHNATADCQVPKANVTLSAAVVDKDGVVRAKFQGSGVDILSGAKSVLTAAGPLTNAHFWSPDDPYLYDVYTMLTVDGKSRRRHQDDHQFPQSRVQRRRWHLRRLHQRQVRLPEGIL